MAYLLYDYDRQEYREVGREEFLNYWSSLGGLPPPEIPEEEQAFAAFLKKSPQPWQADVSRRGLGGKLYSSEQLLKQGMYMPEGWQLKQVPIEGGGYSQTFITPEAVEVGLEDIFERPEGGWITRQELETRRQAEIAELDRLYRGYEAEITDVEKLFGVVYPEITFQDISRLMSEMETTEGMTPSEQVSAERRLLEFQRDIWAAGRQPLTEELIRQSFPEITGAQMEEFWSGAPRGAVTEEGQFIEQGFFANLWDQIRYNLPQVLHKSVQYFTSVLPNKLLTDVEADPVLEPGQTRVRYPGVAMPPAQKVVYSPEEAAKINEYNRRQRDKYRQVYARNQGIHEEWLEKHKDLEPPDYYREGPLKHPELWHDAGYWGAVIGEALPFSLGVLSITAGTFFATRNPYLSVIAGTGFATPYQSQGLYDDLLASGAPEDKAADIALPIGMVIASVEAVSDLPLIGAIFAPAKLFGQKLFAQLSKHTVANLAKKGVTAFTIVEVSETLEEIAQGAIQNAFVREYDKDRAIFENIDDTIVRTLIATSPFAIFGAGISMRHVSADVAETVPDSQKDSEGWKLDQLTGEWYKPQQIYEIFADVKEQLMTQGLEELEANRKALNEVARTPEGEKAISEMAEKIKTTGEELAKSLEKSIDELTAEELGKAISAKEIIEAGLAIPREGVPVTPEVKVEYGQIVGQFNQELANKLEKITDSTRMNPQEFDLVVNKKDPDAVARQTQQESKAKRDAQELLKDVSDAELFALMDTNNQQAVNHGKEPAPLRSNGAQDHASQEWMRRFPEPKPPAVEVKAPPITEVPLRISEMEAELTGLKEWLASEPATKLVSLIKKTGWYKGEVSNLTLAQYRKLTGKEPLANILTKDKKHVRWEYTLDDVATELGYESGEALKTEIERAGEALARIKELQRQIAREPAMEPAVTAEQVPLVGYALTTSSLTNRQIDATLELFKQALIAPTAAEQRAATIELRKHVLAQRASDAKGRVEELIVEGIEPSQAIAQANKEFLSGELPELTTDYFSDLTTEMVHVLEAKVYNYWTGKDYFELTSTMTALTNALRGESIPRKKGTGTSYFPEGGSAYDRLVRVFSDQPEILEAIDQGRPLPAIIEGIFIETGREAVPLTKDFVDYLRGLATLTEQQRAVLEKPLLELKVEEVRVIAEQEYFRRKRELDALLSDGMITETEHDIELSIAKDKVYPYKPVTPLEAPIEDAFKQVPLSTFKEKNLIVRTLKGLGMGAIDIGNLIRANKASFDFSFWRQVKTLTPGHPAAFYRANIEAWKALWSQRAAEANWQWIKSRPSYPYYANMIERTGQDFLRMLVAPKGTAQWKAAEEFGYLTGERAIPRITAKTPWIKVSGRSFVTGTNTMTMLVYDQCLAITLRRAEKIASGEIKLKEGEAFSIQQEMDDYAAFIADMTQRASLGKAAPLAPALGSIFFAVRSKLGRFLTPRHLLSKNPRVRAMAWKDLSLFVGTFASLVMLGKWLDLWDVEDDPRNAEFMSIRIGNMRIDPWAGNRQFLVFYTRIVTGTGVSSVTGAEYEVNPIGALTSFFRTSLSPLASIILDFWTGMNFLGDKVDVADKKQWLERISPFSIWDVWEAFEESWEKAAIAVLPAIFGEGVQTYTGDWVENWAKMGLPKYTENTGYGIKEPYYDTADFWADTASQFKGVDPATLTEAKGFPAYIRAIVEASLILEQLDDMPNVKLTSINAEPEQGATFADYYKMWQDREKIVASGDEEKLKEFDADERTRRAFLGNITQTQFALLMEYHSLPEVQQKDFLEQHPEIGINPRNDWLESHPSENAQLAIWGKAKLLSLDAYNEFTKLLKELDIPDAAIPTLTLPPPDSVENYFKYQELLEEFSPNSWEAQLLMAQDKDLREWLGREPIETPMRALELKIKHRELFDLYDSFADKDSPLYIEDDDARDTARDKLKADNPEWLDDIRRIEAIEHEGDKYAEPWVERGRLIDEFSGGSSEAKVWLLDHPDVHKWALDQDLLADDGSDWNEKVLRINDKWRVQDEEYEALETTPDRMAYLAGRRQYHEARYQRKAYQRDFPETLIDTYVDWYVTKRKDYEDDWFLMEHKDFYDEMVEKEIWKPRDFSKVPTREVYDLYLRWQRLPKGTLRRLFETEHPELDQWLNLKFGTKLEAERTDIIPWKERLYKQYGSPMTEEEFEAEVKRLVKEEGFFLAPGGKQQGVYTIERFGKVIKKEVEIYDFAKADEIYYIGRAVDTGEVWMFKREKLKGELIPPPLPWKEYQERMIIPHLPSPYKEGEFY